MPGKPKAHDMDMIHGPMTGNIIRYALPLMLTGVLQLLYNAVDVVVVGRFASAHALAAVSSTSSLISLIVLLFNGLTMGTSVIVAQAHGSGNARDVEEAVHTSMMLAILCGAAVTVLGCTLGRPILQWMDTPPEVLELASQYVTIYFTGSLFNLVTNFGAAVLRAAGDSKRPMYFLTLSGLLNVALNLLFVIGFDMSVAGVALGTILSQLLSAVLMVSSLLHSHGLIRLDLRRLRIVKDKAVRIVRIGIPSGIQAALFALSNLMIQSAVNSFGPDVMAGNGAAVSIENFISMATYSFHTVALTFTSQNVGARKPERLGRIMLICLGCDVVTGLVLGGTAWLLRGPLVGLYCTEPHVIEYGMFRLSRLTLLYFLCGMMDTLVGGLRGMGNSFAPMLVSVVGACALRSVWVYTVFAAYRSLDVLYLSYPVTWVITILAHGSCYLATKKKITQKLQTEAMQAK